MPAPLPILVAEDEETDVFFLQRAFEMAAIPNRLVVTCDGEEAIKYLNGDPPFADRTLHPLPGLILLDLKMRIMSGFDVLEWLQTRPEFKQVPVVILTSSSHEADRQKARALGASDYRVKPSQAQDLIHIVKDLHARWLAS